MTVSDESVAALSTLLFPHLLCLSIGLRDNVKIVFAGRCPRLQRRYVGGAAGVGADTLALLYVNAGTLKSLSLPDARHSLAHIASLRHLVELRLDSEVLLADVAAIAGAEPHPFLRLRVLNVKAVWAAIAMLLKLCGGGLERPNLGVLDAIDVDVSAIASCGSLTQLHLAFPTTGRVRRTSLC
jgi:hypothetical protein